MGDIVSSINEKMLKMIEDGICGDLIDEFIFTIKPHPACAVNLENFSKLQWKVVTDPLSQILKNYDMAYTSNRTSAAVDAYFFGLPVVSMLDGEELNFSPLRGLPGVFFVRSPNELAIALQHCNQTHKDLIDCKDFFFLDPALPRWRHLLCSFLDLPIASR